MLSPSHLAKISQALAAPRARVKYRYRSGPLDAAVLVPLCLVDDEPSCLFTTRSTKLKNHSGQVSFPGGMKDEGDYDSIDTALRETMEEISIARNRVQVLGTLHAVPNMTYSTRVTPIVGYIGQIVPDKVQFNPCEVSRVFTIPLARLLIPDRFDSFRNEGFKVPSWDVPGSTDRIWGLTAFVLWDFVSVLKGVRP